MLMIYTVAYFHNIHRNNKIHRSNIPKYYTISQKPSLVISIHVLIVCNDQTFSHDAVNIIQLGYQYINLTATATLNVWGFRNWVSNVDNLAFS